MANGSASLVGRLSLRVAGDYTDEEGETHTHTHTHRCVGLNRIEYRLLIVFEMEQNGWLFQDVHHTLFTQGIWPKIISEA